MSLDNIVVRGYFDEKEPGFVRASVVATGRFLRDDNTWAAPGLGSMSAIPGLTLIGNNTGSSASAAALTVAQVRSLLGLPEVTWSLVTKTADTAFTTTTLADVPAGISGAPYMGWTLQTLHTYHFRFVTIVRSSATNIGVGLAVSTPSAASFGAYGAMFGQAPAGPSAAMFEPITASNSPVIASGVAVANTDYIFIVEGVITPNAAGDLRLRARIETGVATVTVRAGSFGMLMDRAL